MPQTAPHYDVVVVGARCAGAATALLLARSGLRVLMVDRSAPGKDTLSTHALMRTGVVLLDRFGVLDAIAQAGTPPVTRSEMVYDGQRAAVQIKPGSGVTALYAPRRTLLDALLAEAAIAAGVDVAFDVTVTDVRRDSTGRVTGIRGHRKSTPFQAHATLTVGADGLRSTVASAVQAPIRRRHRHASAVWYTYVTGVPDHGYRMFFRPGAIAGLTPTNDGATCMFIGNPASEFTVPGQQERWRVLRSRFLDIAQSEGEDVRDAACVSAIRGWKGQPGMQRQAFGPGWALVGDAGYFKDPLGTHGISQALRDAQLLSDAIVEAECGQSSLSAALSQYEQTRDELSAGMSSATDALASFFWDGAGADRLMRQLSREMAKEVEIIATRTGAASALSRSA
jgi:2-polyprenyl-6-methoxyphenol hydroxylase-like FAD-dependent oxidoreductase